MLNNFGRVKLEKKKLRKCSALIDVEWVCFFLYVNENEFESVDWFEIKFGFLQTNETGLVYFLFVFNFPNMLITNNAFEASKVPEVITKNSNFCWGVVTSSCWVRKLFR